MSLGEVLFVRLGVVLLLFGLLLGLLLSGGRGSLGRDFPLNDDAVTLS